MLTIMQERQQTKLLEIEKSLREERDTKRIRYLRDKRILIKKRGV